MKRKDRMREIGNRLEKANEKGKEGERDTIREDSTCQKGTDDCDTYLLKSTKRNKDWRQTLKIARPMEGNTPHWEAKPTEDGNVE